MKIINWFYCLWVGHSYKLVWEDDWSGGVCEPSPLKKLRCVNCEKEIIVKKTRDNEQNSHFNQI